MTFLINQFVLKSAVPTEELHTMNSSIINCIEVKSHSSELSKGSQHKPLKKAYRLLLVCQLVQQKNQKYIENKTFN